MNQKIFSGLPEYVRISVLAQVRKLISTNLFHYNDQEDIVQELLLHYLQRFYSIPNVDEALVVHSLKQYALNMYRKRKRSGAHLTSSLDYELFDEDFFYCENKDCFTSTEVNEIFDMAASDKMKLVLRRIMEGESISEISIKYHVSKKTIYSFFKKIKNF